MAGAQASSSDCAREENFLTNAETLITAYSDTQTLPHSNAFAGCTGSSPPPHTQSPVFLLFYLPKGSHTSISMMAWTCIPACICTLPAHPWPCAARLPSAPSAGPRATRTRWECAAEQHPASVACYFSQEATGGFFIPFSCYYCFCAGLSKQIHFKNNGEPSIGLTEIVCFPI